VRGGCWNFGPLNLRSAFRGRDTAGLRNVFVGLTYVRYGFRVARTLTP